MNDIIKKEPIIVDAHVIEDLTEHQKFANDLREFANFIERSPDIPLPSTVEIQVFPQGKEGMSACARALRSFEKKYCDTLVRLRKTFGRVAIECIEMRDKICERVVVGTKTIKEKVPESYKEVEVVKEIVEWRCSDPLLDQNKLIT